MRADKTESRTQIGLGGGLHREPAAPAVYAPAHRSDANPEFARRDIAEFRQRLQQQHGSLATGSANYQALCPLTFDIRGLPQRVDQDVGVERAARQHSCISSRVNVRKPPRKVTGSFTEAIIRSMAAWRSAARASAGYGDISATGLPRLVMTTCSPVSTAERTSEKR